MWWYVLVLVARVVVVVLLALMHTYWLSRRQKFPRTTLVVFSLSTFSACLYKIYTRSFITRYTPMSSIRRNTSCSSLKQEGYLAFTLMRHFWRFLHPRKKKRTVPRETQNRQLSSPLFFPHEHKSASQFWVVALQFYPTTKNKRFLLVFTHSSGVSRTPTTSYTFFVARCGANEKDRERVASKAYQSVERLTKTSHENSDRITSWDKRASFFQYRCFLRAFWSSNDRSQWYAREVYQKRWW